MLEIYVKMTDEQGAVLPEAYEEPGPGSVVLTHGETGTAWQRQYKDGLWHRAGGGTSKRWVDLLKRHNLILVYEPAPDPQKVGQKVSQP